MITCRDGGDLSKWRLELQLQHEALVHKAEANSEHGNGGRQHLNN